MHLVLVLALAIAPVPTDVPEPSEDPAARAARLFGEGEFVDAAEAFEAAYAATGDPAFVFGRAQALRRAGNCAAAIEQLSRFIDLDPPASDIEEANRVIDSCKRVLGLDAQPPAPEPTPPPVRDEPPPPPPAPAKPRPWHRDPAGGALLGTGLAIAALGGGLLGGSFARARDREAESETSWQSRDTSVRALSISGIVLLAIGGALTIAGAARWGAVARRDRSPASSRQAAR